MKQVIVVPTIPARSHYLKVCLEHIRRTDPHSAIFVFVDRAWEASDERNAEVRDICGAHGPCHSIPMGRHDFYGNSFNVLMGLRAVVADADIFHIVEDDTMVKPTLFTWNNRMHEEHPDTFAACGWVCNQFGPIDDDDYLLPWFYAPCSSFTRANLELMVEHARPEYFRDMRGYVLRTFPDSALHNHGMQQQTGFFEQDAIAQYLIEKHQKTVAWRRTALCHHIGASGYNRKDGPVFEGTLDERVTKVETLLANPHLRAQMFGRAIVEREIGGPIPKREFRYRITLPDGWQSYLVSELESTDLPRRINSTDCQKAVIEICR